MLSAKHFGEKMTYLRLQTINYARDSAPEKVLNEIETPKYPNNELEDKLRFFYFVTKRRGEAGEAVRFVDKDSNEIKRYGDNEEFLGHKNANRT
jgi:hypothetical protein